jgi:GNAT superfamily N-acetyltransferase
VAEGGGTAPSSTATIRRGHVDDAEAIASLYRRVRRECVPDMPPLVDDRASVGWWVRTRLLHDAEVWVAETPQGLVGVMALVPPDSLDQLYVLRAASRQGLGSRFLSVARHRFPEGLQCWTFQSNTGARRFYERHGFTPVEWTDGDNDEGAPDVRYVWRRGG